MDLLVILRVILLAAAIWAVAELALTIRKARGSVDELTRSANDAIGQVQPIIDKVDGAVDDLQPALKQVDPLMEKATTAVDQANESLARVNGILGDVSTVSGTAAAATDAVSKVATGAGSAVTGLVDKIAGKPKAEPKHLAGKEPGALEGAAQDADEPAGTSGYVTYGDAAAQASDTDSE